MEARLDVRDGQDRSARHEAGGDVPLKIFTGKPTVLNFFNASAS
jgi:hypothetical protein